MITPGNRKRGHPPVAMYGGNAVWDGEAWSNPGLRISFQCRADIWLPYVVGAAHPNSDFQRYFDNVEAATANANRLNLFLKGVQSLILLEGGTWEMDGEEVGLFPLYRPWLHDGGVRLDVAKPPMMPPELVDVEWPLYD